VGLHSYRLLHVVGQHFDRLEGRSGFVLIFEQAEAVRDGVNTVYTQYSSSGMPSTHLIDLYLLVLVHRTP
jgi:hypothetical protein